jgi:hypothetical protein
MKPTDEAVLDERFFFSSFDASFPLFFTFGLSFVLSERPLCLTIAWCYTPEEAICCLVSFSPFSVLFWDPGSEWAFL